MDRINPRNLLRDAMNMLDRARCPECGRAYDAEQAAETDCHRMTLLHCSWCSQRAMLIGEYKAWLRQDGLPRPSARA